MPFAAMKKSILRSTLRSFREGNQHVSTWCDAGIHSLNKRVNVHSSFTKTRSERYFMMIFLLWFVPSPHFSLDLILILMAEDAWTVSRRVAFCGHRLCISGIHCCVSHQFNPFPCGFSVLHILSSSSFFFFFNQRKQPGLVVSAVIISGFFFSQHHIKVLLTIDQS